MTRYRQEFAEKDGWSDWIIPRRNKFKMACCDCGLVHNLEFIATTKNRTLKNGGTKCIKIPYAKVWFKVGQNNRATAAIRRKKK